MPGGGGFGDPHARDAGTVAEDVRNGLVTAEAARSDYGVAVGDDGTLDEAATRTLRARGPV